MSTPALDDYDGHLPDRNIGNPGSPPAPTRIKALTARVAELELHLGKTCKVIESYLDASQPWDDHPLLRAHFKVSQDARAVLAKGKP